MDFLNNIPPSKYTKSPIHKLLLPQEIRQLKKWSKLQKRVDNELKDCGNIDKELLNRLYLNLENLHLKQKSFWENKGIKILGNSIDTLYFGVYFQKYDIYKYIKDLENLKAQALNGEDATFKLGNVYFSVSPHGTCSYSYILKNSQMRLLLSYKIPSLSPPVHAQLYSKYLWDKGPLEAAYDVLNLISNNFGLISGTKISRLDIAVDIAGIEFTEEDRERFITRAMDKGEWVKSEFYGTKFSGIRIGKKDLLARIYDKTLEAQRENKLWFHNLWREKGWDGKTSVWRIEMQFRREKLKEFGLNEVYEAIDKVPGLWQYVLNNWIRLTIRGKDRNRSRWKTDYFWEFLANFGISGGYYNYDLVKNKQKEIDTRHLINTLIGILNRIGKLSGKEGIRKILLFLLEHPEIISKD